MIATMNYVDKLVMQKSWKFYVETCKKSSTSCKLEYGHLILLGPTLLHYRFVFNVQFIYIYSSCITWFHNVNGMIFLLIKAYLLACEGK
jgi:hypothetical protein